MFGKKETQLTRDYFWNDASTPISVIRIYLTDAKRTLLTAGRNSEDKNPPYPVASSVIITRNTQNCDVLLDYMQGDKRYAQEIIYGHTISRVEVKFLTS